MIILGKKAENIRIDLGAGAHIECQPMRTAIRVAADFAAAKADDNDKADIAVRVGAAHAARLKAAAQASIVAWGGILDLDGTPIDPSPAAIAELLSIPAVAIRFERDYWIPGAKELDEVSEEKKD